MKPVQRKNSASQSCSCTSCVYKSESEQLSIRKYIAKGSRISRLYFGKYIPLRERKLLNRLVRTRAVYDDLRARLISDSTLSLETNADLRPGKHHRHIKPLDSEKSGAILEIVDLIDKGAALDPKKMSECCSCCSCSSKVNILKESKREEKRKRGFARTYEEEYGQSGQIGKGEGIYAKTYEREYREYGRSGPARTGERHKKRGVQFRAKRIRSEPCTCTFKFSGMIKKHSKAMIRKIHPVPLVEPYIDVEEPVMEDLKKTNFARKSYQKYKAIQGKLGQDIRKLNESREKMKHSLKLHAKKSLEQVKQVKNKIQTNIQSGVRKSVQAVKALNARDETFESFEYPEEETDFKIKKDSIVKFKDYLKRKEIMKDWECDFECEPDTCVPEECFKIIKLRRPHKRNRQHRDKRTAGYENFKREVKLGGTPLSQSSSGVQAEKVAITKGTRIKKQKPKHQGHIHANKYEMVKREVKHGTPPLIKSNSGIQAKEFAITTETRVKKQKPRNQGHKKVATVNREVKLGKAPSRKSNSSVNAVQIAKTKVTRIKKQKPILRVEGNNQPMEKRSITGSEEVNKIGVKKTSSSAAKKSFESLQQVTRSQDERNALRMNKEKGVIHRKIKTSREKEKHALKQEKLQSSGRQAVRISSSFSFDVEFYKTPSGSKTSRSSHPSGIRVHKNKHKHRKILRHHKGSQIILNPSIETSLDIPEQHKTRLIQTDKFNEIPITLQESRLSNMKTNTDYGTKSVSSLTTRTSLTTSNKNISTAVPHKGNSSQVSLLAAHVDTLKPKINNYSPNKQAVRIGSTFSFNVEFYRNSNANNIKTPSIKARVKQSPISFTTKTRNVKRKLVKVKGTSARAYNQAKSTLHRCFCTLKLHGKGKTKKKIKSSTTATVAIKPVPSRIDKYVGTKKNIRYKMPKVYQLQPYECEPGICVPGECDPILCKKMIDLRKHKHTSKSVGSDTSSRKTKSTSSIISRPVTAAKTVQSLMVPTKAGKTNARRPYKEHLDLGHNVVMPERQAVRIGSSFSFNIEFYKDKQTPGSVVAEIPNKFTPKEIKYKHRKFKDGGYQKGSRPNKSMFTQVVRVDKNIGPSLKRCFCTLKLYKNKIPKMKTVQKAEKLTSNTQTLEEVVIGDTVVNRGTKARYKYNYKLLPFECEPYVCVPGECDPYLCLEKIKRRKLNTRDNGVFTDKPEMASVSSLADDAFKKAEGTLIQPRLMPRGTNMKSVYMKPRPKYLSNTGSGVITSGINEAKQAVKVGSSFKFSIEFSKQLPDALNLTKYPNKRKSPKIQPKLDKDKGITVTKYRVNHVDTQAIEPRRNHRGSLVRPILKRCFCTLNLQKTKNQYHKSPPKFPAGSQHFGPQTYTVGRAMTDIISHSIGYQTNTKLQLSRSRQKMLSLSSNSFVLSNYHRKSNPRYAVLKFYSMSDIPIIFKQPLKIKSNLSLTIEVMRQLSGYRKPRLCKMREPIKTFNRVFMNDTYSKYTKLSCQPYNNNLNKLTDINRYLERCFYTMNVQVSNPGVPQSMKKLKHKLKPYECEPGICIPGECDPHECKKLIMRRFIRNAYKSSGTNSINKSLSSYTTPNTRSDSRSTQIQTSVPNHSQEVTPQRYKIQRHHGSKQRQAVRLGSSFSFNLEFYKSQSQPFEKHITGDETKSYNKISVNQKPQKFVNNKVQANHILGIDSQLQKSVTSVDRATGALMKRCFCTLKLQKKGRIHRENVKLNTLPKNQPQTIMSKNARIGTTVKYRKIPDNFNDLKSYECEPGICIPGECDPYKCLERIKRRKDFGINTTRNEMESVSSMASEAYAKGKYKSRGIDTIPRQTHHKTTKAVKYVKGLHNYNQEISRQTSRQAVRIGSTFSFNIDFFKDTPQEVSHIEPIVQRTKAPRNGTRQIIPKKEMKGIVSQTNKKVSHRDIQVDKLNNQVSTEVKRPHTIIPNQLNNKSFKNRCFCVLGLRKKEKDNKPQKKHKGQTNVKNQSGLPEKPVQTVEKPTNTNFSRKVLLSQLKPYECEPGICIPGQCNPYLCDKIIQQRRAQPYSKGFGTESVRTQSVSSEFGNKRHKHEKNQAQFQTYQKQIQRQQRFQKSSPPLVQRTFSPDRRLVRIGSNFNFNIEIFKENVGGNERKVTSGRLKDYPTKNFQFKEMDNRNTLKNTGTETPKNRSNESQVKKKEFHSSGVNPLLKRCFCTLKLLNKPKKQNVQQKIFNQKDTKPKIIKKSVETQSKKLSKVQPLQNKLQENRHVLSPYECEPFVCVPGECDPVECLKKIKRRHQQSKDFGAVTKYPKSKSIGSEVTKKRHELLQAKFPNAIPKKHVQKTFYAEEPQVDNSFHQARQAVRIGSNFSFNVEFFKDVGNDMPKAAINQPLEEINMQKLSKKNLQRQVRTQSPNYKHDTDTQSLSTKIKSTETGMQHLKRCFCTLQLKNKKLSKLDNRSMKDQTADGPKSDHSSVGDFIKKCVCTLKLNKVGKQQNRIGPPIAVQYALKGTSTEQERIMPNHIKKLRSLEPYECEPYFCVPGECDPYECLKRIQQRQVRHCGTDYKQYLKDSATDSIKHPVTKSTKSQYSQKRKLNSRGTSFVSKYRRSKDTTPFSSQPSYNPNRQAVRIGSNFSFNVEFFKDSGIKNMETNDISQFKANRRSKIKARSERLRTMPTGSDTIVKRQRCKSSQITCLKKYGRNSAVNTVPRRCFCTLKLLKNSNHPKIIKTTVPPTKVTKDKTTATKVKYTVPHELGVYECPPLMCIPGECNPYECLDKMKKRGIIRRGRNAGTRVGRTSTASVGTRELNLKGRETQSQEVKNRNTGAFSPKSEPHSEILQCPRIHENVDKRNRRAVRIGSNFNFNVEFFKQKFQPGMICVRKKGKARVNEEESMCYFNKNVAAGARNVRNFNSQMDNIKVQERGSDAGNLLKRCFCTLQLQKPTRQNFTRKNTHAPGINVTYPQAFTVGRVAIEPFNKNMKLNRLRKADKTRSTTIDPKLFHKTVGTKTKEKYLSITGMSQCNPNNCPEYSKNSFRKSKKHDMQILLPYTPSKFNRKESKTIVKYCDEDMTIDRISFGKGKRRLTAKKSKKSIPTNTLKKPSNNNNSFFCRCVNFFTRRSETKSKASGNQQNMNNMITEQINERARERRHESEVAQLKLKILPKKENQKSTKAFVGQNCPNVCPNNTNSSGKWCSKFQRRDADNNVIKTGDMKTEDNKLKKLGYKKNDLKHPKMRVTFADNVENSRNDFPKGKKSKSVHSKSSIKSRLCYSCSEKDCPLYSNNSRNGKKAVSYSESADDCQYCECCKRRIDVDEVSKGGGDRPSTKASYHKKEIDACPCGKESLNGNQREQSLHKKATVDNVSHKYSMKKDKCCVKDKPLFDLLVDSVNYGIINKGEVRQKVDQLGNTNNLTEHSPLCRCCKCIGKLEGRGAKITVAAKGPMNLTSSIKSPLNKFFSSKTAKNINPAKFLKLPVTSRRPCICGSKKCAAESKSKKSDKKRKKKDKRGKTCKCGTDICKEIKKKREKVARKAKRKAQHIKNTKEMKEVYKRLKIEQQKDEVRRKKRIKRNRELEARVKKYKDSSDTMLAIDSLLDIGKLGVSSLGGALRYTAKALYDPKVACERCKICKKKDPESLLQQVQKEYIESDAAATARRLKMRCLFMKKVQTLREKLEENPVSHFILHIADKNAKTRQFKPKPKRHIREPLDFQCSLYMASLRKRPHLAVYYKCPWFYPHFITMLNIWKQFTDIMLFLLAAVVWSPCILCMEGCRALLCCFFCTG